MRALEFFGCSCTELWMPDNLRSGVTKASRYEPDLNPTYHHLAEHYGVAVLLASARRLSDKAKVENGGLVVTRGVLARPHDHRREHTTGAPRSGWLERANADGAGRPRGTALRGAGRTAAGPAKPSPASLSHAVARAKIRVAGQEAACVRLLKHGALSYARVLSGCAPSSQVQSQSFVRPRRPIVALTLP